MVNDVIDRYQILEKIGAGGMGTVYLAWDRDIEREVALKWLPAYFSQDEHFTERFKREARVVARLEHPHIVPIYDVGENEGRPFIIMRLLKGGTLREQIGKQGFNLAALVKGLEEIGDALAAAHARHIIHRDIKPGNILFDENGAAFLSDFGIAKVLDSATQLTGSGFIGTPAYMSPEQFIGQEIDGRCDQYALAVVVYEALTGSLPFQGNTAQMMYKHINAAPPEIDLEQHPIPSSVNPVLQKALAKDPNNRYARIMDFTTALRIAVRQDPAASALPLAAGVGLVPTPQKPITAPTQLDTPPEQKSDLLQQDYREGLEAMSRSQWAVALAAFDRVLQAEPDYGNAAEFKLQAEANLSQAGPVVPLVQDPTIGDPIPAVTAEPDLEETSLDLPAAAVLAAAGVAAVAPDLAKTSLDLPAAIETPAVETTATAATADLDKTSLDLPTGAVAAAGAGAVAAAADLDRTSLDLPPAAAMPPAAPPPVGAATPSAASAQAPEKKRGIPLWAMVGVVILLLLLCGGGAYAAVNIFGGADDTVVAEPPAGGVIAASAGQGNVEPVSETVATEVVDTAEPEPTKKPLPEPTEEPSPEPLVVVEDTAEPPTSTPTDEPTETPEPQAPKVRVSVASANLRRGPGVVYRVLQPVFEDDTATMVAKNRDGSWFLVQLEDGTLGWLSAVVVDLVDGAGADQVQVAATIPVAPTNTPVPPTLTPLPLPTEPPPTDDSGGGGGGGGNDGGGSKPPPVYTAEPP